MKTRKHGNGMSHKQVIDFICRLASSANDNYKATAPEENAYLNGWNDCAKYFRHQLAEELRWSESFNGDFGDY